MTARDMMSRDLASVDADAGVEELARLMKEKDVGCIVVTEGEKPIGVVTDRDLVIRCLSGGSVQFENLAAHQLMNDSLVTIPEEADLFECIRQMRAAKVRRVLILDAAGRCVGVLSFGDILAFLSSEILMLAEAATPLTQSQPLPRRNRLGIVP